MYGKDDSMSESYKIFSLDEVANNDTAMIADENVTVLEESVQSGDLCLCAGNEPISVDVTGEVESEEVPMIPVNGVVMNLTEEMSLDDVESIEEIADDTFGTFADETVGSTDISDTVEEIDGVFSISMSGKSEVDGEVEDVDVDGEFETEQSEDIIGLDFAISDTIEDAGSDEDYETTVSDSTTVLCETGIDAMVEDVDAEDSLSDELVGSAVEDDTYETNATDVEDMEDKQTEQQIGDIKYTNGMTLLEFLRANPAVRDRDTLEKYFSAESVTRALRSGMIVCMHGKISL